jgi:predicted HTH domain antitoxin
MALLTNMRDDAQLRSQAAAEASASLFPSALHPMTQATVRQASEGVTIRFPQALLVASREDLQQFQQRVMVHTLGPLYEQGRISSGLGAQILGCDRWDFYRLLSEYGFSVLDYAADEQESEAESSRDLAARVKQQ